jgi:methionyl-tRNA formyltransferase
VKQDPALVTKAPKIKKEFGLIDWTKPADYIERFVRAMQPWPTAYTFLHRPGKEPMRVIVNCVQVVANFITEAKYPIPGRIHTGMRVLPHHGPLIELAKGLVVWAGNQSVVIVSELQPAGKKRMTSGEFLRGHDVVLPDVRFGPEVLS